MAEKSNRVLTFDFAGSTIKKDLPIDENANSEQENSISCKELNPEQLKKEKDKAIVKNAMIQGRREYNEVKKSYDSFIKLTSESAMFGSMAANLKTVMDPFFEVCDCILKGQRTPGVPEEFFKEAQINVLKSLVNKYNKR